MKKQLVLTYTDTAKKKDRTHIRIMSLNSHNRVVLLSQTTLDDRISSITSVKADKANGSGETRFFVDALLHDNKLITEILVWNSDKKSFVQLISQSLQYDRLMTARSSNLYSYDIDADGIIEIPKREQLFKKSNIDTSSGYMLVWYDYNNGSFIKERSYIVNVRDNYRIYVPDAFDGKISVKSESKSVWSFFNESSQKLFDVTVYKTDEWPENSSETSLVLHTASDKVYVCHAEDRLTGYGIDQSDLIKYFSLNS